MVMDIRPTPTDDEVAAIVAAIDANWPIASHPLQPDPEPSVAWRFSGRWWQRDRLAHAERPWR